jgi:hypothetical protein
MNKTYFDGSLKEFIEQYYTPKPTFLRISLDEFDDFELSVTITDCDSPVEVQLATEECQKAFKDALPNIVNKLKAFDAQCAMARLEESKGEAEEFHAMRVWYQGYLTTRDGVGNQLRQAKSKALSAIKARLLQIQAAKKDSKAYNQRVAVKLLTGAGALVASGGALAGTVVTGGVSALAIIGTSRALAQFVKTLADCWKSADVQKKVVMNGLNSLEKTYRENQLVGAAREGGAGIVKAAAGVQLLPNVGKLKDDNKLWGDKLSKLLTLANGLSTTLDELLNACQKLQDQLPATDSKFDNKRKALKRLETRVNTLLTEGFKIPGVYRRVKIDEACKTGIDGLDAQNKVTKRIEELEHGRGTAGKVVDGFNVGIDFLVEATFVGLNASEMIHKLSNIDFFEIADEAFELRDLCKSAREVDEYVTELRRKHGLDENASHPPSMARSKESPEFRSVLRPPSTGRAQESPV